MTSLTKKEQFCLDNKQLICYFKHIGDKKAKLMVNLISNRVMEMNKNQEKWDGYMKQLHRSTNAFVYTFNKSPF